MFRHCLTLVLPLLALSVSSNDDQEKLYRYRYTQADLMKTAESKVPVSEYEISEGYMPHGELHPEASIGYVSTAGMGGSGGFGGGGFAGGAGFGGGYYPGAFIGGPGIGAGGIGVGGGAGGIGVGGGAGGIGIGGGGIGLGGGAGGGIGFGGGAGGGIGLGGAGGIGHHYIGHPGFIGGGGGYLGGIGGEVIDKKAFVDEGKKAGGGTFEKAGGQVGQEFKEGQGGYNKGKVYVNNAVGDAGYEKQNAGQKKAVEDEKSYFGGQAFNQEGKNADEKMKKGGHKKGHKIKGFKTTHHKDESGKTEEFYDEEHDEGSDFFHKNEKGAFGENAGAAFKGGHDNGVFNSGEKGHQSNFKKEELLHKDKAEEGEFGAKKYGGNQKAYGLNSGLDHHSLSELQEGNKFFKHLHVPFHSSLGK